MLKAMTPTALLIKVQPCCICLLAVRDVPVKQSRFPKDARAVGAYGHNQGTHLKRRRRRRHEQCYGPPVKLGVTRHIKKSMRAVGSWPRAPLPEFTGHTTIPEVDLSFTRLMRAVRTRASGA